MVFVENVGVLKMAENSKIEWTDHTFNPWMGCTKVSPACANCYAERDFDHRYGKVKWGNAGTRVLTSDANWQKPMAWNRTAESLGIRYRVFCASLADVFEDWQGPIMSPGSNPVILGKEFRASKGDNRMTMDDVRLQLFDLIDRTPNLDWLLLTKRPENIERMWFDPDSLNGFPHRKNVWLGTSVENQEFADKRIPELLKCRDLSPVLFLSCEPLTGPVNITRIAEENGFASPGVDGIDWVITGGESGPNARPADPEWFRSLRDQCEAAGVPFHFKQWGEFGADQVRVGKKNAGRLLDGMTHDGLPIVSVA
jgi:protein gp37